MSGYLLTDFSTLGQWGAQPISPTLGKHHCCKSLCCLEAALCACHWESMFPQLSGGYRQGMGSTVGD